MINGNAVEVNGRRYALPEQPTVVICVDGCEPDYIAQAVAGGQMPHLKRVLSEGTALLATACAEFHQPEQPVHRDQRSTFGARHLRQHLVRR